jgi:hypothetical protein
MLSARAAGTTIHHEAIDWAKRTSSNGGTISTTVLRAVSDFCAAIDRGSIRDRFLRLNLFAGGNLSGALVPLYRSTYYGGTVIGTATDTNENFVSSDYAETGVSSGILGNGTNKSLNPGVSLNAIGTIANMHMAFSGVGVETGTNAGIGRKCLVGLYGGASGNTALIFAAGATGRVGILGSSTLQGASLATESLIIVSRSSTTAKMYQGGSLVSNVSDSTANVASTFPLRILAMTNASGIPVEYSAARCQSYSLGLSLTDTQAAVYSSAMSAFRAALGRA